MSCANADPASMTVPCFTHHSSWLCATSILQKFSSHSASFEGTQLNVLLRHSSMPANSARELLQEQMRVTHPNPTQSSAWTSWGVKNGQRLLLPYPPCAETSAQSDSNLLIGLPCPRYTSKKSKQSTGALSFLLGTLSYLCPLENLIPETVSSLPWAAEMALGCAELSWGTLWQIS